MYETHHDSGTVTQFTRRRAPHAQEVRFSGSRRTVKVTIGDVDLPAFVSNGYVYIQAPLPLVFQAFGEDLSDFVRDLKLEYQQRAPTLSLGSDGRAVLSSPMAEQSVVPDRRVR